MINTFCCAALAAGLEVASLWLLGGIQPPPAHILYFFCAHSIACLTVALIGPCVLPVNYRETTFASCLLIFLIAFCIPLFGMCGIAFGLVPALWKQRELQQWPEWLHSRSLELRSEASSLHRDGPVIGEGHLLGVLLHAKDQSQRLQALVATLSLDDRHAVPLLRSALKDMDDEVRLLAYALMMRKEKALEDSIRESMSHLADEAPDQRFAHHRALAQNIWELAHLGQRDSAATLLCDRARTHAEAGLQLRNADAGLQFLLGRILLRGMNLDGARIAFRRAGECGIDIRKVMPFLAEIAFHEQRFSEVGSYLKAEQFAEGRFPLNHLAAYWDEG